MAHLSIIIDGGPFEYIAVGMRHGLRLVIIIQDTNIHRIFRKKLRNSLAKLGRQRFIVGDDQRRLLDVLLTTLAMVWFTRTGDAQKGLNNFITINTASSGWPFPVALGS